jgi:hypothetical protein
VRVAVATNSENLEIMDSLLNGNDGEGYGETDDPENSSPERRGGSRSETEGPLTTSAKAFISQNVGILLITD